MEVALGLFSALLAVALVLVALRLRATSARLQQVLQRKPPRARSQEAEREALRLGRILAAMPDGVMVIEADEITYANPATSRLLGGDPVRILPTARASLDPSFLFTVHHPVYREVRCSRTTLDQSSQLIVVRDVTEARRLDRMRADFVANASHELKTPVAAILATTETLSSAIEDDVTSAARFVRTLGVEAKRLGELVKDLLDLARLDQAEASLEERCDVVAVVREETAQRGTDERIRSVGPASAWVPVRHEDLRVAIRNLLDNAIRHTSPGGSIEVAIDERDGRVIVEVSDTGEGIPAKDLPRIFERFYRVDPARGRDTGGTGLGLAIVKHVVESAGGNVTASSIFGEGSTFRIELPASAS